MNKSYQKLILILIVLTSMLVSACGQVTPAPVAELPSPQVTVILEQTSPPTSTLEPTSTPTPGLPTDTPTPFLTATETETPCTNQAEFVKSLSISDNTNLNPGTQFTKTWQVRNVGTCTWSSGYQLVMIGGDQMQAPYAIDLPHEVKPQETVDLAVKLVAPETPATYTNSWVLKDAAGVYFGIGAFYDQPLIVQIVVPTIYQLKPT